MRLNTARVLLTGAAGGIGRAIATELTKQGAHVLMVDRDEAALHAAARALGQAGNQIETRVCDLTVAADRSRLCQMAASWRGGVNVLINNAGLNPFGLFDELSPEEIDRTIAVNVLAPMHLCHGMLPHLRTQPQASILNVGSVFGSIGYPAYATYSASKFAVRGFTEALRRELAGSAIRVHYIAPRATRTPINSSAVDRMNAELRVATDPPEVVAQAVVAMLASDRASAVVGWPEKLFVKVNALIPKLVDNALRKQLPIIKRHAQRRPAPSAPAVNPSIPRRVAP